jgi:hypothetical protein
MKIGIDFISWHWTCIFVYDVFIWGNSIELQCLWSASTNQKNLLVFLALSSYISIVPSSQGDTDLREMHWIEKSISWEKQNFDALMGCIIPPLIVGLIIIVVVKGK